jgi:hypothetical protein
MKKHLSIIALFLIQFLHGQTVADFENFNFPADTFWNGSSQPLGTTFTSGNVIMENYFDTAFVGYWTQGWAYSTMMDSSTSGFGNLYSTKALTGYNSSLTYVVGQQNAKVMLSGNATGGVVSGCYVTNATYPANSMRDGDMFAKKFGGVSGNDPDFFKLMIRGWFGGQVVTDSVEFYLADYRFANNTLDYIVTDWQWVDLSSLGNVDSLWFILSSSDVGAFGINTPLFFCADHFITADSPMTILESRDDNTLAVYPNPFHNQLTIETVTTNGTITITDISGRVVFTQLINQHGPVNLDLSYLSSGVYTLSVISTSEQSAIRIIKR